MVFVSFEMPTSLKFLSLKLMSGLVDEEIKLNDPATPNEASNPVD